MELKNTTFQSILQQAGGSITWRRRTCRLRRHRPRPQIGNATFGRQEVGIPGILHGLTILDFFRIRTSFGWPGDKLPDNRRACGHNNHSHNTFVHVQVMRTLPAQMFDSRTTRTRVAQAHSTELHALVPQKVVVIHAQCSTSCRTCHRTLLHDLSHLPQLSSDHFLPHCPVLLQLLPDWIKKPCEIHGGVADTPNLHLPQVMSPS